MMKSPPSNNQNDIRTLNNNGIYIHQSQNVNLYKGFSTCSKITAQACTKELSHLL